LAVTAGPDRGPAVADGRQLGMPEIRTWSCKRNGKFW
jgi:hypothetical protein